MELTTITSVGLVLASVGYYFREIFYKFFESPFVSQLLNATFALTAREGAELVVQAGKEIVLVLAKVLHVVLHIGGQALLLINNILHIVSAVGSVLYSLLYTANSVIQSIFEFPGNIYTWITTPPGFTSLLPNILWISMIGVILTMLDFLYRKLTWPPSCKREDRSGKEE